MANVVLYARALDFGLNVLDSECDQLMVCSQQPTTYIEATATYALGLKNFGAGNAWGAESDATPDGRHVTSVAFNDGTVTATGTATAWAAVDTGNSRLLATGILSASTSMRNGQNFGLGPITVRQPQVVTDTLFVVTDSGQYVVDDQSNNIILG